MFHIFIKPVLYYYFIFISIWVLEQWLVIYPKVVGHVSHSWIRPIVQLRDKWEICARNNASTTLPISLESPSNIDNFSKLSKRHIPLLKLEQGMQEKKNTTFAHEY